MVDVGRCAVLLRAVNVAGRPLKMERLREVLQRAGATDVLTIGASGNAVLRPPAESDPAGTERTIEQALASGAGLRTEVFVRTASEWKEVVRRNPYPDAARTDPAHLVVTFLRATPPASGWASLRGSIVGREMVAPGSRHAYIVYPDGIGRSRLTAVAIERQLGCSGTSRNWNTVLRIGAELGPAESPRA